MLLFGEHARVRGVGPNRPRHAARTDPWVPLGGLNPQKSPPILDDLRSLTSQIADEGLRGPTFRG